MRYVFKRELGKSVRSDLRFGKWGSVKKGMWSQLQAQYKTVYGSSLAGESSKCKLDDQVLE